MNPCRLWFKWIVLFNLTMLIGVLAGCSSDSSSSSLSSNESLRIYEMSVTKGSFTAVAGDATSTKFQLNLSEVPDQVLYFTNRGAQEGGYDTVDNVMNKVWPRVYGTVAPNVVMQATTADRGTINLRCILDRPVYNGGTGQLGFTITYLDGQRPESNQALTDVKIIIANNAASAQPGVWSQLMAGDAGTLTPAKDPGIYTFSMQNIVGDVYEFTCAPQRKSSNLTVKKYIDSWQTRFGTNPPNATIAYNPADNPVGGVQIVTLTNPVYDENIGSISFTAKLLYGTAPIGTSGLTIKNPSLFVDGNDGGNFPVYAGNIFSIQYRNSTENAITVWFDGTQPPCSQAMSDKCVVSGASDTYSAQWEKLSTDNVFEQSGTYLYITKADKKTTTKSAKILNHIDLEPGETLRLVPPIVGGYPQWYFNKGNTAGVAAWVTRKGVDMPAIMKVNKFEYNLAGKEIWADMGGVDGINVNATMALEGPGCGTDVNCGSGVQMPRSCKTNIAPYGNGKDQSPYGCPYILNTDGVKGANTCANPNQYPIDEDINAAKLYPAWVVAQSMLTTASVMTDHKDIYDAAKKSWDDRMKVSKIYEFGGRAMASAPTPDEKTYKSDVVALKKAYHIWWATNPAGQGWLNYLQNNKSGTCDQYGWAFDEKRWNSGDTFDVDGNPPDNKAVAPLWHTDMKTNTYLNIDILKIM